MLILIAKFRSKPEHRQQIMDMSHEMLEPSRSEEGCMSYEFLQDAFDPDSFTYLERWRNKEDLDLHFEMSYFKDFAEKLPDLIEGSTSLITYEVSHENKTF